MASWELSISRWRKGLSPVGALYTQAYRAFAYLGLMSLSRSLLFGFRYQIEAAAVHYGWNLLLYLGFRPGQPTNLTEDPV